MRFIPQYELNIIKDDEFATRIKEVENELKACQNEGYFETFDGNKLYYEYFLAENSTASVVIVHGLSEFTKKYYEMTYYFLNQGYNVFVFDLRCHGLSDRLTKNITYLHVKNFGDYVKDLSIFIKTIVEPADDKPIFLYSHSMGGAIATLYLAEQNPKVKKALVSSPLYDPVVIGGVSKRTAKGGIGAAKMFLGSRGRCKFTKDFDPDTVRRVDIDSCECRFNYNMDLRRSNIRYQTSPMTWGWVYNSLLIRDMLMDPNFYSTVTTPILLLSSEKDRVVKNDAHAEFASKCAACQMVTVKGANHSMLTGERRIIEEHINRTMEFFAS